MAFIVNFDFNIKASIIIYLNKVHVKLIKHFNFAMPFKGSLPFAFIEIYFVKDINTFVMQALNSNFIIILIFVNLNSFFNFAIH